MAFGAIHCLVQFAERLVKAILEAFDLVRMLHGLAHVAHDSVFGNGVLAGHYRFEHAGF